MVKQFLFPLLLVTIATACASGDAPLPEDTGVRTVAGADGGTLPTGSWIIPEGVWGTAPSEAKGLPAFSGVMNQLGEAVSPDDLVGHFSVLWFFPLAHSPG